MATTATTFVFPTLKLKKTLVNTFDYDRLCFQFLVGKNNVCTLLAYKLSQNRGCKRRSRVIELEIYKGSDMPVVQIRKKALFVQLELTVEQVRAAIRRESDSHLWFLPRKDDVQGYNYVIYRIGRSIAVGDPGDFTSPCPPAVPPDGYGGGQGS